MTPWVPRCSNLSALPAVNALMLTFPVRTLGLFLGVAVFHTAALQPPRPRIRIVSGSRPDGGPTDLWLTILRRRLSPADYDSVMGIRRPRSAEQQAWARLVEARAKHWPEAVAPLQTLFDSTTVDSLRVVLGNRGGEDAFTHDSLTIGFDLAALQRVYGDAAGPENADRLDRIFRHEFVHLLQKRWLRRHPFAPASPLEAAVLDAWAEGLGNYYSLSARWRPTDQIPSPLTAKALDELQHRFVARMTALACADSVAAIPLLADLSSGPFDKKWGALPVALWLLAEADTDPSALHAFATAGPGGVWTLAERHLPSNLADSLTALRQRPGSCHT